MSKRKKSDKPQIAFSSVTSDEDVRMAARVLKEEVTVLTPTGEKTVVVRQYRWSPILRILKR